MPVYSKIWIFSAVSITICKELCQCQQRFQYSTILKTMLEVRALLSCLVRSSATSQSTSYLLRQPLSSTTTTQAYPTQDVGVQVRDVAVICMGLKCLKKTLHKLRGLIQHKPHKKAQTPLQERERYVY